MRFPFFLLILIFAACATAQPVEPVLAQARAHKGPLLDTLKELVSMVDPVAEGGGTDAAFAALKTRNAVLERFGLRGFGAHSTDDEYVLISSIEPRLYLAARLIMDIARDRIR